MKQICVQINWQRHFGGGEVYTRFFTEALRSLGWDVSLIVDRTATFWRDLDVGPVEFLPISHGREIPNVLPAEPALIITHTTLPPDIAQWVAQRHMLAGIIHMPLTGRSLPGLAHYHRLFAVSDYVRKTVLESGHPRVHPEPLLGVADLKPRAATAGPIVRRSEYDWDRRKFRDRVCSWLEPLAERLRPHPVFAPRQGLTLGIVSRLTPIKQFPLLFSHLAPVLSDFPDVHLEVFGSGGYASVRDLKRALTPIRGRVRFWGHQPDPAAVYAKVDHVLSGLPEREALGLNLIEAQACGTPVLAVSAPPFDEVVVDGVSGYLYTDPRLDGGKNFAGIIRRLASGVVQPDPRLAAKHLTKFSANAFQQRVARAMSTLSP